MRVESVTEKAQNDAEFQDLFQLLTTKVTAEEYLSFVDDVETHEETINTTQVDWHKTMREKCIQEVTNDVVEDQIKPDYEGSDHKIEEIEMVDNLKPVDVMHMLEQIKTMTTTSTDRACVKSYDYIYKKVQKMSI